MAVFNQTYNFNNQFGMGSMNFGQGLLYGVLGSLTGALGGSYNGLGGSLFSMMGGCSGLGNMYGSPSSFFGMGDFGGYGCCGGFGGYSDSYYTTMAGMSVANVLIGGISHYLSARKTEKAEAKANIETAKSNVETLQNEIDALNEENESIAITKIFDSNNNVSNAKVKELFSEQVSEYNTAKSENTTAVQEYTTAENELTNNYSDVKINGETFKVDKTVLKEIVAEYGANWNNPKDKNYKAATEKVFASNREYDTKKSNLDTTLKTKKDNAARKLAQAKTDLETAVKDRIEANKKEVARKTALRDKEQAKVDGSATSSTETTQSRAERQALKLAEKQQKAEQKEIEKKEEEARKAAEEKTKKAWEGLKPLLKNYNQCQKSEKAQIGNQIKNYINNYLKDNANAQKILNDLKLKD